MGVAASLRELGLLVLRLCLLQEALLGSPTAQAGIWVQGAAWGQLRVQEEEAAGPAPRSSTKRSRITRAYVPAGTEPTHLGA